jgi:16S rRNA processing protein RimM
MSDSPILQPTHLVVGEILRPHGVTGELKMRVLTEYPEHLAELTTVFLTADTGSDQRIPHELTHVRMHQGYALIRLKGIADRNAADRLRQLFVMIAIEDAVPLEEDELYLFQIVGLTVYTEEGQLLGTITEVLETGANDVYIITAPDGKEILIPVIPQVVLSTDKVTRKMTVRLSDGLLPPA